MIEPPDSHHLSATIGWLELGNSEEAKAELQKISPALNGHPDVLEIQWLIHAHDADWQPALSAANALVNASPDRASGWLHRAYALRRVKDGGLPLAWDALLPAFEKFPNEPVIPYNLSCYACQMGRLDDAREWFKRAVQFGGKSEILEMALKDPDLEPLWGELRKMVKC